MSTPYLVQQEDQAFQAGVHRDVVNAYPAHAPQWRCLRCGRTYAARTWRYFWHNAQRCTRGPDSPCYLGPLCPQCSEVADHRGWAP